MSLTHGFVERERERERESESYEHLKNIFQQIYLNYSYINVHDDIHFECEHWMLCEVERESEWEWERERERKKDREKFEFVFIKT